MSTKVAKPPVNPTQTKGIFFKHVVGDTMTLKRFVREALKDAIPTIKVDPYLKRALANVESEGNLKKAYQEVDFRVAKAVDFYLRNRSPNERVRAQRVSCVSATDLTRRQARCIVTVEAWGHMRREIIDLELPE